MDALYVLGTASTWQDNELRYSLRSLQQHCAGIDRLVIVGTCPTWLRDVIHIKAADPHRCKERNIMEKVLRACYRADLSGDLLFLNDDHFALAGQEATTTPNWWRGTLAQLSARLRSGSHYKQALLNTAKVLDDRGLPGLNFDVHRPIIYNRQEFKRVMASYNWELHRGYVVKSLYANTLRLTGTPGGDVKIGGKHTMKELVGLLRDLDWFSTGPTGLNQNLKALLAALYPEPSRWEVV